jgi:hypothetical protein
MRMIQTGYVTSVRGAPHRIRRGELRSSGRLKDLFYGSEITDSRRSNG